MAYKCCSVDWSAPTMCTITINVWYMYIVYTHIHNMAKTKETKLSQNT